MRCGTGHISSAPQHWRAKALQFVCRQTWSLLSRVVISVDASVLGAMTAGLGTEHCTGSQLLVSSELPSLAASSALVVPSWICGYHGCGPHARGQVGTASGSPGSHQVVQLRLLTCTASVWWVLHEFAMVDVYAVQCQSIISLVPAALRVVV